MTEADVVALAQWPNGREAPIVFMPARLLMQDFTEYFRHGGILQVLSQLTAQKFVHP